MPLKFNRHNSSPPSPKADGAAASADATSDAALMVEASRGDRTAFAQIVERYQTQLVNFFRYHGVYNDAEDLVQQTFVRLYRYRNRYRPTAKLRTFLYLLARQVRTDWLRKHKRRQELCERLQEQALVDDPNQGSDAADPQLARAAEALKYLSEEMRSVIVLSIYQGLKYREIADILEIPEGTVKTRMYHGLRKLRAHLEATADE